MEKQFSMPARIAGLTLASALAAGLSTPASAQSLSPGLILPTSVAFIGQADCLPVPAPSISQQIMSTPQLNKNAAILGGMSALERMRQAQQTGAATTIPDYVPNRTLAPAGGGFNRLSQCGLAPTMSSRFVVPSVKPLAGRDILASRRIAISQTMFDADWSRVSKPTISTNRAARFLGRRPADRLELIDYVNRTTNHRIRYVEDRVQWGRPDYWAGADATLRTGRGDCEDFAIAKMQLLIASGLRPEDLTLTIARDMVHGSDHAVLLVRHEGRYLLLDNVTDRILDGSQANEYKPIFSYSAHKVWLHGYALAG